jgi:hypothetical protein
MLIIGGGAISAFVFLAVALSSSPAGRGTRTAASALVVSSPAHPAPDESAEGGPISGVVAPGGGDTRLTNSCTPTSESTDYLNPLAGARVKPERIDQGVDYAGSGTLAAIGAGTITYVASDASGWPGAFIEYRLLDGSDSGCYVYYAEGVTPASGLHVGEFVAPGQPVATIIPLWATGIEIGWGAGTTTTTYAEKKHQWSTEDDADNIPSAAGKNFSALIASLGGPPGKNEG